jgi:hypothetical protein
MYYIAMQVPQQDEPLNDLITKYGLQEFWPLGEIIFWL